MPWLSTTPFFAMNDRHTFLASTAAAPDSLYPNVTSIQWWSSDETWSLSSASRCLWMKSEIELAHLGTSKCGRSAWIELKHVASV
jgi:hypothetical protein